jgi:hypothetical protein
VRKLFQLSTREFWVLMQAGLLLPVVRVALKFVTVARLQRVGARTATKRKRDSRLSPESIARLVRVAAEHGPCRAGCLPQSLVLRWLLSRRGLEGRIVFGARRTNALVQAHAWVEVNGVALSEDYGVYRDFSPLDELVAGK